MLPVVSLADGAETIEETDLKMCDARATQEHCGMCSVFFFFFNFFFNFTLVTVDLSPFAGVAGLPG